MATDTLRELLADAFPDATELGSHTIDEISEIAGDVSPADFPSAA